MKLENVKRMAKVATVLINCMEAVDDAVKSLQQYEKDQCSNSFHTKLLCKQLKEVKASLTIFEITENTVLPVGYGL